VVEGTPLLRVHLGKTWIQGSNPCVSASESDRTPLAGRFVFLPTFLPTSLIERDEFGRLQKDRQRHKHPTSYTSLPYNQAMLTIVETPTFSRLWPHYWTEEERGEFAAWLAENPESGDVVRKSGGVRKVRWKRAGSGKSGGVRVVYFNRLASGEVWLLFMYAKAELDSIAGEVLREMKDEIEKAID
jgi:hypothetical protein